MYSPGNYRSAVPSPGKPASRKLRSPSATHSPAKPVQAPNSKCQHDPVAIDTQGGGIQYEAGLKLYISQGHVVSTVMTSDSVPAPPGLTLVSVPISHPPSYRHDLDADDPSIPIICLSCFQPWNGFQVFRHLGSDYCLEEPKVCGYCSKTFTNYEFGIGVIRTLKACRPCCEKRNRCQCCRFSLDDSDKLEMTEAYAVTKQPYLDHCEQPVQYEQIYVCLKMRYPLSPKIKIIKSRKSPCLAAQALENAEDQRKKSPPWLPKKPRKMQRVLDHLSG